MPGTLREDELTPLAHLPQQLLDEQGIPQRPRVYLVQDSVVDASAWKQRPHESIAIRTREPLQLETEAEALTLGRLDHAPQLAPRREPLFAVRADDQPAPLGSQRR